MLKRIALLALLAAPLAAPFDSGSAHAQDKQDSPPLWNVVLILADDLGWRDLGCAGSTFYETPAVDRLASQGM